MNVPRETSRYNNPPRSMEFAAVCFVVVIFLAGIATGFVLRPYLLAGLA